MVGVQRLDDVVEHAECASDGTFSLASPRVTIPLNTDVSVPVKINPTSPGAHSALLQVDDGKVPGVEFQTMNTVVAAYDPITTGGTQTVTGSVARGQAVSHFFKVPAGTTAMRTDLCGPDASAANRSPGSGRSPSMHDAPPTPTRRRTR